MEYKCNNCKKKCCEGPSDDQPYSVIYCSEGHWAGGACDEGVVVHPTIDWWADCKDFELINQ